MDAKKSNDPDYAQSETAEPYKFLAVEPIRWRLDGVGKRRLYN